MVAPPAEIIQWLLDYKYLLLFPIAIVEGPFVTVLAGFLASIGKIDIYLAFMIIISGDLIGDSLYYAFGKWGGRSWVRKWGHHVGMTQVRIERLENHFKRHPGKTLMLGKVAHGLGGPFLAAAGLSNMPYGNFLFYNLLPTAPKSLLLILLGFYSGHAYQRVTQYLDSLAVFFCVLSLSIILLYIFIPKIIRALFKIRNFKDI